MPDTPRTSAASRRDIATSPEAASAADNDRSTPSEHQESADLGVAPASPHGEQSAVLSWSPIHESDIPLAWPSRDDFLTWLDRRDSSIASKARVDERLRAQKEAEAWLTGIGENYAHAADALLDRIRYALARALSEEGMPSDD